MVWRFIGKVIKWAKFVNLEHILTSSKPSPMLKVLSWNGGLFSHFSKYSPLFTYVQLISAKSLKNTLQSSFPSIKAIRPLQTLSLAFTTDLKYLPVKEKAFDLLITPRHEWFLFYLLPAWKCYRGLLALCGIKTWNLESEWLIKYSSHY